jgi:phage/plasmid-associated DNA primase
MTKRTNENDDDQREVKKMKTDEISILREAEAFLQKELKSIGCTLVLDSYDQKYNGVFTLSIIDTPKGFVFGKEFIPNETTIKIPCDAALPILLRRTGKDDERLIQPIFNGIKDALKPWAKKLDAIALDSKSMDEEIEEEDAIFELDENVDEIEKKDDTEEKNEHQSETLTDEDKKLASFWKNSVGEKMKFILGSVDEPLDVQATLLHPDEVIAFTTDIDGTPDLMVYVKINTKKVEVRITIERMNKKVRHEDSYLDYLEETIMEQVPFAKIYALRTVVKRNNADADIQKIEVETWKDKNQNPKDHWVIYTGSVCLLDGGHADENARIHFFYNGPMYQCGDVHCTKTPTGKKLTLLPYIGRYLTNQVKRIVFNKEVDQTIMEETENVASSLESATDAGYVKYILKELENKGHYLLFDPSVGMWYHFAGSTWQASNQDEVHAILNPIIAPVLKDSITATKVMKITNLLKITTSSMIPDILKSFGLNPHRPFNTHLNAHRHLLGVPNGVLHMKEGRLLQGDAKSMISLTADVEIALKVGECVGNWTDEQLESYMDKHTPNFKKATREAHIIEEKLVERVEDRVSTPNLVVWFFLLRLCGYILTGETRHHLGFFFLGNQRNGKSTICKILFRILGFLLAKQTSDYSMFNTSEKTNMNQHDAFLMALQGKRLMLFSELSKEVKLSSRKYKAYASAEYIMGRLFGKPDEKAFPNLSKMVFQMNNAPQFTEMESSTLDKVLFIRFQSSFLNPKEDDKLEKYNPLNPRHFIKDEHMEDKLEAEIKHIFVVLLHGCTRYYKQGLLIPEEIQTNNLEQKKDIFKFDAFVADCVKETAASVAFHTSTEVFQSYKRYYYTLEGSNSTMTATEFHRMFKAKFEKRHAKKNNSNGYKGLSITLPDEYSSTQDNITKDNSSK